MKTTWALQVGFCLALVTVVPLPAAEVFSDDFTAGPSPLWANERGNWQSADGVYFAQVPDNVPPTFSSLPFYLGDFAFECDVNQVSDGGIWLRSNFDEATANGVLLVTGGWQHTGTGFYWHVVHNDNYTPALNQVAGLFSQGDNIHVRVEVVGDSYRAYFNHGATPVTTLVAADFAGGYIGLYDYSGQNFDNVVITAAHALPDYNRDDHIDLLDYSVWAGQWLANPCQSGNTWCGQSDLNFDGAVDALDLETLAALWLGGTP